MRLTISPTHSRPRIARGSRLSSCSRRPNSIPFLRNSRGWRQVKIFLRFLVLPTSLGSVGFCRTVRTLQKLGGMPRYPSTRFSRERVRPTFPSSSRQYRSRRQPSGREDAGTGRAASTASVGERNYRVRAGRAWCCRRSGSSRRSSAGRPRAARSPTARQISGNSPGRSPMTAVPTGPDTTRMADQARLNNPFGGSVMSDEAHSSPVFPANGSLLATPPFPRSGPSEAGSPTSSTL